MRICNLGSLNFDKVYDVQHFVVEGETLQANAFEEFIGGKGLNQSIALARAGAQVWHVGAVGHDGELLVECLQQAGVHTNLLSRVDKVSGHAIIQNASGKNNIIVYSGANGAIEEEYIDQILGEFAANDILLLQNEVSNVSFAITRAKERGMKVAFNPSPITDALFAYPLDLVDYFILNETEAAALCGTATDVAQEQIELIANRFPQAAIVMTLGARGVMYRSSNENLFRDSFPIQPVDTTGAGDTFCGYFIAEIAMGSSTPEALYRATVAANLAIQIKGAANSIPTRQAVDTFLMTLADNPVKKAE